METSFLNIDISLFKQQFPFIKHSSIDNDFFIADLYFNKNLEKLKHPLRFDGYFALFCIKGELTIDLNLNSYKLKENSLLIYTPNNIMRIHNNLEDLHCVLIAVSKSYMSKISIDFNNLVRESLGVLKNPCIQLTDNQKNICNNYLNLANNLISYENKNKNESIGSLFSSLFYFMGNIWKEKLKEAEEDKVEKEYSKAEIIFEQFIHLVTEQHNKHRDMGFYAKKLFLSPKYLSKLIKEVSGHSGPEWIDSFVILEAKSVLKYSKLSIKEIIFELNFPNESSFYKFFKAHTGMTPNEYRNS